MRVRDLPPQRSTHPTLTAARLWAADMEQRLRKGELAGDRHSLVRAMERYAAEISPTKKGVRWEQVRMRSWARSLPFAERRLDEITPEMIGAWRDARLRAVSSASVIRDLALLGSVFEAARREWRWILTNPVRDVRRPAAPPPRQTRVSDDQAQAIFAAAGYTRGITAVGTLEITAAAFDLALQTAMRAGEIIGLTADRIDLKARVVRLEATKNGARREVPLSTVAVEILRAQAGPRPFPISSATLDQTFRRLRERAGLAGQFRFHDSRAEATTRLAKVLDIHDLARVTGHRDYRVLMGYYRATASEIAQRLG